MHDAHVANKLQRVNARTALRSELIVGRPTDQPAAARTRAAADSRRLVLTRSPVMPGTVQGSAKLHASIDRLNNQTHFVFQFLSLLLFLLFSENFH